MKITKANSQHGIAKAGVTNFNDTFVLNRPLVFQINSSDEIPHLRQYRNRKEP
jgi:hypothetical protein